MTDYEMECVIAEKVMGWTRGTHSSDVGGVRNVWLAADESVARFKWHPLRSIADGMDAWEKFSDGKFTCIDFFDDGGYGAVWIDHTAAHDKDLLRAMCRCIVRAVAA